MLVTSHSRSFSILDSEKTGRTADGEMFRDVIGTFYNYKMTIRARANGVGAADLDALWDILSEPTVSHVCTFPYNQGTIHTTHVYHEAASRLSSGLTQTTRNGRDTAVIRRHEPEEAAQMSMYAKYLDYPVGAQEAGTAAWIGGQGFCSSSRLMAGSG